MECRAEAAAKPGGEEEKRICTQKERLNLVDAPTTESCVESGVRKKREKRG